MSVPICFVDTETTDVGHRRLAWEMAVIRREPDGTRKELQTFVEVDLADASPFALKVGRFHGRHPLGKWLAGGAEGDPWEQLRTSPIPGVPELTGGYVTQRVAAALWCRWTHGAHVIGAVPNFDTEVMAAAAREAGLLPGHHYHLMDIENLIVGYLRGQLARIEAIGVGSEESFPELTTEEMDSFRRVTTPPWSSDDLFAEIGVSIPDDERHTALGDARGVEKAWDVIMGGAA